MQRWIFVSLCSVLVACSGSRGDSLDNSSLPAVGDDAGEIGGNTQSGGDASDDDAGGEPSDGDAGTDTDAQGTVTLLCGNGELDPGEQCDDGDANSDTEPGACRVRCVRAACGDGILDTGEECDDGQANSDHEPDACRLDCRAPRCGDAVRDANEECDTGEARSDSEPSACRLRCVSARCGDSVRDNSEGCDDGNDDDNDACRNSCRSASCGDGARTPDEECDDSNNIDGDGCQANCRNPRCGDGVRDANERCDDGNTANNDGCRNDCQPGCVSASACDDGTYCNGAEQCADGLCQNASAPSVDDGVACTVDACDEANDNASHAPDPNLCNAPPRVCAGGVVTEQNVSCVASSGCAISPWTRACADQPSTCNQITNGFRLLTYAPACNAASNDCGLPALTGMQDCTSPGARCEGRVGIVSRATCNPAAETCGVEEVSRDNCARLDVAGRCAQGNRTWSRATGVCGAGSCSQSTENQTCTVPGNTCSTGRIITFTTYAPSCTDAGGCGNAVPASVTCTAPPSECVAGTTGYRAYTAGCTTASGCSTSSQLVPCTRSLSCTTLNGVPAIASQAAACDGATGRCAVQTTACRATCDVTGGNRLCAPACGTNANGGTSCITGTCSTCPGKTTCQTNKATGLDGCF